MQRSYHDLDVMVYIVTHGFILLNFATFECINSRGLLRIFLYLLLNKPDLGDGLKIAIILK